MAQLIASDPKIMIGKPVIVGTRITVESSLERLGAGESVESILDCLGAGMTPDQIFADYCSSP